MKRVLVQMGMEPGRLKLLWASAAEGQIFANEVNKFVAEVRELGPLNWKGQDIALPAETAKEEVPA
jgi:heterodisulfide reductase subunit A